MELRRIEDDIAAGRIERPRAGQNFNQPIPGAKRQPMIGDRDLPRPETDWRLYHHGQAHAPHHVSPRESRGQGASFLSPESFHSDVAEMDNSGRYRSYKDSSGDQGDVDSGDDYYPGPHYVQPPQYRYHQQHSQSPQYNPHPQHPPYPPHPQHPQHVQPQRAQHSYHQQPPPYPGAGPSHQRVVIGGYTHQTPL